MICGMWKCAVFRETYGVSSETEFNFALSEVQTELPNAEES